MFHVCRYHLSRCLRFRYLDHSQKTADWHFFSFFSTTLPLLPLPLRLRSLCPPSLPALSVDRIENRTSGREEEEEEQTA